MKIQLLDYRGSATWVDVPDDTEEISGVILSGDMVMERPIRADASDDRIHDWYDGAWFVKRKDFDRFNALTDSYGVFDLCYQEEQ